MGRQKKGSNEQKKPPSRFKGLCDIYRIKYGHINQKMLAEKLGGYNQSQLSVFETRSEGPPLGVVERYADFFKLEKEERLDFYKAALEASDKIVIDQKMLSSTTKEPFHKLLAFFLSTNGIGNDKIAKIIEERKGQYYYKPNPNQIDQTQALVESWRALEKSINTFITEGVKNYDNIVY